MCQTNALFLCSVRYFDVHPEIRNKMGEEKTLEGIVSVCEVCMHTLNIHTLITL